MRSCAPQTKNEGPVLSQAVPLAVLGRLQPVPAAYLKQLATDNNVFPELPENVQRQARAVRLSPFRPLLACEPSRVPGQSTSALVRNTCHPTLVPSRVYIRMYAATQPQGDCRSQAAPNYLAIPRGSRHAAVRPRRY